MHARRAPFPFLHRFIVRLLHCSNFRVTKYSIDADIVCARAKFHYDPHFNFSMSETMSQVSTPSAPGATLVEQYQAGFRPLHPNQAGHMYFMVRSIITLKYVNMTELQWSCTNFLDNGIVWSVLVWITEFCDMYCMYKTVRVWDAINGLWAIIFSVSLMPDADGSKIISTHTLFIKFLLFICCFLSNLLLP